MTQGSTQSRPEIARRGLILILSSPSGAGKTTLTRAIAQRPDWNLELSISVTTRSRRPSEIDGRDYRFIDREAFDDLQSRDDLLEWAEVHGNFYGTPRRPVEKTLVQGRDMIFDIDYQGTRQVRQRLQDDVVTVFILPPSIRELRKRLERRAQDSKAVIDKRLKNARIEMDHFGEYDYVIINRDLEESVQKVRTILAAARLARTRYKGMSPFVRRLQREIDSI